MLSLASPVTPEEEDRLLAVICQRGLFMPYHAAWALRYHDYRLTRGDPFAVAAADFPENVKLAQYDLYDSRSRNGLFRGIRHWQHVPCCPMCGAPTPTGSIDHYLPRDEFPEFSVLPCNCVPACLVCNTQAKRAVYRGDDAPERFIHPYFDNLAERAIWQVEVLAPFGAPRFRPTPSPNLEADEWIMTEFHLDNILGEVFQGTAASMWSKLPRAIALRGVTPASPLEQVREALAAEEVHAALTLGLNGWRAALLRGVLMQQDAIDWVGSQA
ncbi:hypothetical protein [Sphingomonas sp. PvP056]|uniref:hypothetical protein n=1 Tax=Sphingomonas sp. PvP056 TaxID=3156392 RepID=UPI00339A4268